MADRPTNTFLARLPDASWERLSQELRQVDLLLNDYIYRPGSIVETVYFPLSALISQVNRTISGQGVETAMAGIDGAAGLLESLGSGRSVWESMVQVDGVALAAPSRFIRWLAAEDPGFASCCWRLVEQQTMESQQSVACQALHAGEQRLARWILEAHDRTRGRNPLPLTQETLASMLGVQRTTVTAFQARLQDRGMIGLRRGRVEVLDREGLDHAACECRRAVRERRMLLGLEP